MPTYRPDPRAYLQLRQGPLPQPTPRPKIPEWQMGDDVLIDEGLPPGLEHPIYRGTPGTQPTPVPIPNAPLGGQFDITNMQQLGGGAEGGQFISESGDKNPTIKTRVTKQGKRVFHQRYYEQWQNGQYVGDVLIDPEPWLAEEPEEEPAGPVPAGIDPATWYSATPQERENAKNYIESVLTDMSKEPDINPGPGNVWKAVKGRWTQVEQEKEAEARTKQVRIGDYVYEYPAYKNPTTGIYEIDYSQSPTLVSSPGNELETDAQKLAREKFEYDKGQDVIAAGERAADRKRIQETEAAQLKIAQDREARIAQAWALNPRNSTNAISAYLKANPMAQARELPDNGLDYGPQGGYTPTALPPQQTLSGMIKAAGVGVRPQSYVDVVIGQNGQKTRIFEGTQKYNDAMRAGVKPVTAPTVGDLLSKIPFNEQMWNAQTPEQRATMEAAGSGQGLNWQEVDPVTGEVRSTGEYEKFVRDTNIPFWQQAQKEQEDERLNQTPAFRNALASDERARLAPYLREQEARKQGTLSSALRGTGRRRY